MKKLLLTLGGVSSIAVPIISVVSCGAVTFDGVGWDRSAKTLYFNLNGSTSSQDFAGKFADGGKIDKGALTKLESAIDKALGLNKDDKTAANNVRDNNVLEIDINGTETVKMTFTGEFAWNDINDINANGKPISKTTRFTQTIKFKLDNIKTGKRTVALNSPTQGINHNADFNFISAGSSKTKQIPLKTNFAFALIQGLFKQGFINDAIGVSKTNASYKDKEYESFIWEIFVKDGDVKLDSSKIEAKAKKLNKDLTKSIIFDDIDLTSLKIN